LNSVLEVDMFKLRRVTFLCESVERSHEAVGELQAHVRAHAPVSDAVALEACERDAFSALETGAVQALVGAARV
jgi:hypothetical protein